MRDVRHFALRLKGSLVHVCVRHPSVLLLTAAPVIPWSHDTHVRLRLLGNILRHPSAPPFVHPPTHPPLFPPSPSPVSIDLEVACHGWRFYSKRATFIFKSQGKRQEPTGYSNIKPSVPPLTFPGPPSLSTSIFPPLSLSLCSLMRQGGSWDKMTRTAREENCSESISTVMLSPSPGAQLRIYACTTDHYRKSR